MGSSPDRRRALTVDARVRRYYLAVLVLFVAEIGLLSGLGVAVGRAQRALPAGFPSTLLIGACGCAFLASLLALVLAAYATIHTHRMAGSALSIRRALSALREDKPSERVQPRPSDYLQDVAAEVNELALRLQSTSSKISQ